ncbi:hypothetical protein SAMN04488063_1741 [Halopelagius inordinatus]|uniref:TFIIB-type zinc ribbon-containing protein n=1 Tax=Halopelagius inordinatus TaxID=553467 RepID=A0A1I2R0G4_9EURY|nr:hypothetical protein [Halopelagius inordinatus]SFG34225.1 hypothetical protein SAMN04488063_1741 [Halopelagius inordinatus]
MRIRGRRRCKDCHREWAYYDTGSVTCPDCGSLRSVGIGDRKRHTDAAAELDLTPHRNAIGGFDEEASTGRHALPADAADDLKSDLRAYVRERGFVRGGELRDVDDTYLAANELLHAADAYARLRDVSEDEHLYVISLLRGADRGERPDPAEVPPSLTAARGLAYAETLSAFRRDCSLWLDDNPDADARRTLETLGDHLTRVEALEGDVPLRESEALVRAARELARYAREGDEAALATARDRLTRLS